MAVDLAKKDGKIKVLLLDDIRVEGKVKKVGETVTLKSGDARLMISAGKGVDADDDKAVAEAKKAIKAAQDAKKAA